MNTPHPPSGAAPVAPSHPRVPDTPVPVEGAVVGKAQQTRASGSAVEHPVLTPVPASVPVVVPEVAPPVRTNAVVLRIMLTTLVVLVGMTALEAVKQLTSFSFVFWETQNQTIVLIALVSSLTAYFALRQYRRVMRELEAWQEKLRDNNEQLARTNTQYSEANLRLEQTNTQLEASNVALQNAIQERDVVEAQLIHNACYDPLTQLPNRALYMSRLEQAVARVQRRPEYQFAALFLDLDGFKVVNDSLGHLLGDQLLVEVARRLGSCLRTTDTCARLGGDEFTILIDEIHDVSDATRVAERLQHALSQPFRLEDAEGGQHEVFPSASIGITLSRTGYEKAEDVLRDADTAMYRAKGAGRARHETFDPQMHAQAMQRLQLERDLRHAIESKQFIVHYQPIVELDSGRITGFETLSRWISPTRGMVSPADFIPIAEETGLIVAIDRGALLAACQQMSEWQREHEWARSLKLNVNLSTKQFAQRDIVEQVRHVLEDTGLKPCTLNLEITESALMQHADCVPKTLAQLRKMGVSISLDDFGTGYSSLSYLHRFPLDMLKIDRSFISRLGKGTPAFESQDGLGEGAGIVQTIISLAQHMNMTVVAEGVETPEQVSRLQELGCRHAQGFYFSRPVAAEVAARLCADAARDALIAA